MNKEVGLNAKIIFFYLFIGLLFFSTFFVHSDGALRGIAVQEFFTSGQFTGDKFAPLQTVLMAPLYLVGLLVEKVLGIESLNVPVNSFKIFNVIMYALTSFFVYRFSLVLGKSKKVSFVISFLFAVTSMYFVYTYKLFSENLVGLLILLCFYYSYVYLHIKKKDGYLFLVSLFLFLLTLANYVGVIVFLPVALLFWFNRKRLKKSELKRISLYIFGSLVATGVTLMGYNYFRYGQLMQFGYESEASGEGFLLSKRQGFLNNPMIGLYGMFLSTGKSIFLYNPFVLLFFPLFKSFKKDEVGLFKSLMITFAIWILVYSSWWAWYGGLAWGPRFLVPLLPMVYIIIGYGLFEWANSLVKKIVLVIISLMSLAVQLVGIVVHPYFDFIASFGRDFGYEPFMWFVPKHSPVIAHFSAIGKTGYGFLWLDKGLWFVALVLLLACILFLYLILRDIKKDVRKISE